MEDWSLHPDYTMVVRGRNAILYRRWHYHQVNLNADASVVVQSLVGGNTVDQVIDDLGTQRGLTRAAVREQCAQVVAQLEEMGILRRTAGESHIRIQKTRPSLDRVFLELTRVCNLRCRHCYAIGEPSASIRAGEMSRDELFRLLDEALELGVWTVDLTGGEVLTHPHFAEVLRYLHQHRVASTIFSNLTLLTEEHVKLFVETQVKSIATSIDGLTSETHDSFRGQAGALERTRKALRMLLQADVRCLINTTLTPHNRTEILALAQELNDEFAVGVQIAPVVPAGRALENPELNMSVTEAVDLMHKATRVSNKVVAYGISHPATNWQHVDPPCGVGRNFLYVSADGGFQLCPSLTEREDPSFCGGKFPSHSLREVWENAGTFANRRHVQCREIASCPHASACQGGCRSRAFLTRGELDSPDEVACAYFGMYQTTKSGEQGSYETHSAD